MKKIILLAAAAFALASCENNDDNIVSSQEQLRITATIGESVSRAKDTEWGQGDCIGISSTIGPAAVPYINLKYTTEGDGKFKGATLFYYKPMTLTAYYPFTGTEGEAPGLIKADTGADNQTPERQPLIDFLWDSKTNQDQQDFSADKAEVNFTFAHKMSKLMFAFKGSREEMDDGSVMEVKVSDIVAYEIEGLVMNGTFDPATGICAIDNDAEKKRLRIDIQKGSVEDGTPRFPLIVFPQKPGNKDVKLHVYTDELVDNPGYLQHYVCTLTFGDGELKPGNSYKYTIQVTKVGLKLGDLKIDDWNKEREVNLTASIDGDVKNEGHQNDEQQ